MYTSDRDPRYMLHLIIILTASMKSQDTGGPHGWAINILCEIDEKGSDELNALMFGYIEPVEKMIYSENVYRNVCILLGLDPNQTYKNKEIDDHVFKRLLPGWDRKLDTVKEIDS
jgi:hypothetical protein